MKTNDSRCMQKIKSRIAIFKAPFKRKETVFTSKSDLKLR
jgi:hypothetical protein